MENLTDVPQKSYQEAEHPIQGKMRRVSMNKEMGLNPKMTAEFRVCEFPLALCLKKQR